MVGPIRIDEVGLRAHSLWYSLFGTKQIKDVEMLLTLLFKGICQSVKIDICLSI